jgi:rhodanese-related sulfurtransferase
MLKKLKILGCAAFLSLSSSVFAVDLPVKTESGYVSPETVAGVTTVDAAKAHELWQARAWFVDPRKPEQFDSGRIPGALNIEYDPDPKQSSGLPDQALTEASLSAEVPKEEAVVFYCNAEGCDRSSWAAALAAEWGWQKVYYFRMGFPDWKKAGYPVE